MAEPSGEAILASTLPGVIVVGWPDGLVMFSHDRLKGGPPFAVKYSDRDTVERIRSTAWNALEPLKLRGFGAFDVRSTAAFVAGSDHSQRVHSTLELSPETEEWSAGNQAVDLEAFKQGWSEAAAAMRSVMDATTPCSKRAPTGFQQVVVPPIR